MVQKNNELQQMECRYYRNDLSPDETQKFGLNLGGFDGESDGLQLLHQHGHASWHYLHDLWIDAGGITQLDIVIITDRSVYIVDSKNYSYDFEHQNQQSFANGRQLNKNIFVQLSRSMEKVKSMLETVKYSGNVQGKIVFINPDSIVKLDQSASQVGMNRAEFVRWIQQTAREEAKFPRANINAYNLRDLILNDFKIENPYPPKARTMEHITQMKRGIRCEKCQQFEMEFTSYKVVCQKCGQQEVKERAVLRTICEYGVIRYKEDLRISECEVFFAGEVSKRYISRILSKYFVRTKRGKHTAYENKGEIFEYAFRNLKFQFKNSVKRIK